MIVKIARNPFKSTGGRHYAVTSYLTLRGVTKSVTLTVEDVSKPSDDPWGHQCIGVSGSAKVNRKDFGLMWNTALWSAGGRRSVDHG
jgi:polyisoprenoid-binding protein YceI